MACHVLIDQGIPDDDTRTKIVDLQNLQWQLLYDKRHDKVGFISQQTNFQVSQPATTPL